MEFGIERCIIQQPNLERISTLAEKDNYLYLGILEVDSIKQAEVKEKNKKWVPLTNEKASWNQTR